MRPVHLHFKLLLLKPGAARGPQTTQRVEGGRDRGRFSCTGGELLAGGVWSGKRGDGPKASGGGKIIRLRRGWSGLVVGGTGWLYGGVAGAVVFKLLQDALSAITPQYWMFWIGLFLIILVLVGRERLLRPWTWRKGGRS